MISMILEVENIKKSYTEALGSVLRTDQFLKEENMFAVIQMTHNHSGDVFFKNFVLGLVSFYTLQTKQSV